MRDQFRIDEEDECDLVPTARTSELNKEGSILMPKESEYQQHHRLAEPLNQSIRMTSMLNTSMVNDSFVMVEPGLDVLITFKVAFATEVFGKRNCFEAKVTEH